MSVNELMRDYALKTTVDYQMGVEWEGVVEYVQLAQTHSYLIVDEAQVLFLIFRFKLSRFTTSILKQKSPAAAERIFGTCSPSFAAQKSSG